jgi:membrane-bound metal-dependent hydrolase YbcI (DUF457 family)
VDPLSHVAFAATLSATGRARKFSDAVPVALVLGALAPDLDAVAIPRGWDIYLRVHEIGTHSVAGAILLAGLVAFVVGGTKRDTSFSTLFMAAAIGTASHLLLDLVSGAQIRLGWPLVSWRVGVPLVAMAEPFLVAVLATGGVFLLIARKRRRRIALVALGAMLTFLTVKTIILNVTMRMVDRADDRAVSTRLVEARWASLTEWYVYERTPRLLLQRHVQLGRSAAHVLEWPVPDESALVAASRSLATVDNFLHVHDFGFAIELPDDSGTRSVLWSDIRYCWRVETQGGGVEPVVRMGTSGGQVRIACALWFGGAFDRDGIPIKQLVKVGGWWQTRPPAP